MSNADGPPTADLLERFLLGALTPEEQRRVEHYVANDPNASQTLHGLHYSADTLLNAIQASQSVPPAEPEVRDLIDTAKRLPTINSGEKTTAMPGGTSAISSTDELTAWKGRIGPAERPDEIGRLGSYRLLRVLSRGGMGVVFEAEDPRLGRRVALKVVRPSIAEDQTTHDRFLREARATAAVEHENIITIHQVGEDHGVPYLAMPLLQGESLEDRLRRDGRLPVEDVIRIGREIALGLAAAHDQGLIHRDIKPGNIWLDARSGRVKILDFGLARGTDTIAESITQTGAIVGTPAYMAPEQAEGLTLDNRCDLFSLGCVLYRLATSELPFPGNSAIQILSSLASRTPPPAHTLVQDIPPALSDVIAGLMAKSPADRPTTAAEVCQLLDRVRNTPAATVQPVTKPNASRGRWIMVLVALAAMGGVGWLFGGTILLVVTNQGELTIHLDDPNIEVIVRQNDAEVHHKSTQRRFRVRPVNGKVEFLDPETGAVALTRSFEMKRAGEQSVLTVTASEFTGTRTPSVKVESDNASVSTTTPTPSSPIVLPEAVVPGALSTAGGLDFDDPYGRIDVPVQLPANAPLTAEFDVTHSTTEAVSAQNFLFQHPRNLDIKVQGDRVVLTTGPWPDVRGHFYKVDVAQSGRRRQIAATVAGESLQLFVDGRLVEWKHNLKPETLTTPAPIYLGRPYGGGSNHPFSGFLHRVRISSGERYSKSYTPEAEWQPDETTLVLYDFRSVDPTQEAKPMATTTTPLKIPPYPTTPDHLPAEFTPLFNGKDLTGWRAAVEDPKKRAEMPANELAQVQAKADEQLPRHWRVSDGILICDGHGHNLQTVKDYADFELYLEWKIGPGGDSGVYLRGSPQVQIWDSATVEGGNNQGSGGLYNNRKSVSKPFLNADKPVGEWNAMFIRMVGEKVTVSLNGKLVVDNVVYENEVAPDHPIYSTGTLDLQRFGQPVEFRNIRIRELTPSEPQPGTTAMVVQDLSGKGNHGKIVSAKWVPPRRAVEPVAPPAPAVSGLEFSETGHIDTPLLLPVDTPLTAEFDVTHGAVHPQETHCFLLQHPLNLDIKIMGNRALVSSGGWPNLRASFYQVDVAQPGRRRNIAVTSSDTALQLFVDGKLSERKPASKPDMSGMRQRLKLGLPGAVEGFRAFNGLIHRVRISTGERYDKNYTPEAEWQTDEKTLLLYDFRTTDPGTEAQDLSGKLNHGQILSSKWVKGTTPLKSLAPKPAIAPFDADTARAHQEAWAKHLGVPVEVTSPKGIVLRLIPPGEGPIGLSAQDLETVKQRWKKLGIGQPGIDNIPLSVGKHTVRLTQPFYMAKFEFGRDEYLRLASPPIGNAARKPGDVPISHVTWLDAVAACNRLSQAEGLPLFYEITGETVVPTGGLGYRLPTSAEWEHAFRAGTITDFPWPTDGHGDEPASAYAWYDYNSEDMVRVRGQKEPNPFGLHDMAGNVSEWCWDAAGKYFEQVREGQTVVDPQGPPSHPQRYRTLRGGHYQARAESFPAWSRYAFTENRYAQSGFRVVRTVTGP